MVHVAIVGAYGSAGAAVAGELADEPGVELTLVDDGDPGGGLCILRGCMPSKEVISAGAHRYRARRDDRLVGDLPEVDARSVVARKDDHTLEWAGHRREAIHELAEQDHVEFVHDTARFVDDTAIEAGGRTVDADYVVVATGSTPNVPDLPGIDEVDWQGSADVLDATEFPDSAVVMGFGAVGMELVPYVAEAGDTSLTVIEHDQRPLDDGDPEFGDELVALYERDFDVDVRTKTYEQRVEPTDDGGVRLHVSHDEYGTDAIDAERLYLFTGRRPATAGLGLENAGIEPGRDWVRDTLQARDNERVFLVGDVNGREPVLHVAKEEGFTAAANVLAHHRGEELRTSNPTVHRVVFSGLGVYPFARVGHNEASAAAAGLDYTCVSRKASDDGVFVTKDAPDGRAKLVVDPKDGTVLGWQGLHYHADVMAKTMQVVVEMGLDVREVPDRAYHPTTPELLDGLIRDARESVGHWSESL